MSILAKIKRKDFERILKNDGFKYIRASGDHNVYKNDLGDVFTLPFHGDIRGCLFINYCRRFNKEPYEHIKTIKKNKK